MKKEREQAPAGAATVARYRLSLVREPSPPYLVPVPCDDPRRVARFLSRLLEDAPSEVLGALFLDVRHRAIGHTIAYCGTLTRTTCEPRGLLAPALLANAAGIILFHNHPTGDPSPSTEDLVFTRKVEMSCDVLGLRLIDHLIVGEDGRYASLRRVGW